MAVTKSPKTNALRLLDKQKIAYQTYSYTCEDGKIDGISVAHKVGIDPGRVFKTLVTQGTSKQYYVFIVNVADELDLKKAAKAAGEKSIVMIHVADINKVTGYIRGGCSPIGMKKAYPTFLDLKAAVYDGIVVSAGKIGLQMDISRDALCLVTGAKLVDLAHKE